MVSTIYVAKPLTSSTKKKNYETGSAPYFSGTLTFTLFSATTLEFESPTRYSDASLMYCTGKNRGFGGILDKRTETTDGYKYKAIDYNKRLFGRQNVNSKNKTISSIMMDLLKKVGLPTGGIRKTITKHAKIVIKSTKLIDICHQLANMEELEFFVNQDGIPILRKQPVQEKGYVIYGAGSVTDYSFDYDASNIITGVKVFGKDDKELYNYSNSNLVVKYGNIQDIISDSNITSAAEAKAQGQKQFKENGKVKFEGTITIPTILNIRDGEKLIFIPPHLSEKKAKIYWAQSVKIDLAEQTTMIQVLNQMPSPPNEWIYTPPTDECEDGSGEDSNTICATMKPSCGRDGLSYRNYDACAENKCPGCGKEGVLTFRAPSTAPEGEWHCTNCGMDYCICGKEKWNPPHTTKTVALVSGPTLSNNSVGKRSGGDVNKTCTGMGGAPSNLVTPSDIRVWVDANISYEQYVNSKYTVAQVVKYKRGNCYDQSALVVALCDAAGIQAYIQHLNVSGGCGGYAGGHYNVKVYWGGAWYTIDCTCHAFSTI